MIMMILWSGRWVFRAASDSWESVSRQINHDGFTYGAHEAHDELALGALARIRTRDYPAKNEEPNASLALGRDFRLRRI